MRVYLQPSDIDFEFSQNKEDFLVDEIPSREFAGRGKYLIARVQKQEMTTWDMVAVFARYLGIEANEIGYAGLKDKHATTTQYLSFDARYIAALKNFHHKNIKIIDVKKDTKSIRMGDLAGNRFGINIYDVDNIKAGRIEKAAHKIQKEGLANYFGYQRFGKEQDALIQAKEMLAGERFVKDSKVKNFLVSVYQSYLFNEWLKKRVQLSQNGKFKLFAGDVFMTMTPEEKLFTPKEVPLQDFLAHKVTPTGLLPGRGAFRARGDAREIEKEFDDEYLPYKGFRRAAIVWPEDFSLKLRAKEKKAHLRFTLPKGAYATSLIEAFKGEEITPATFTGNKNRTSF